MITTTVVFIVCPVRSSLLINQREKRVDPQRRARGLRGYLSTGSHPMPSRMYEHTDVHKRTHRPTHTHTHLSPFDVLAFTDVTNQTVAHNHLLLITFLCQHPFPNSPLILPLIYILTKT